MQISGMKKAAVIAKAKEVMAYLLRDLNVLGKYNITQAVITQLGNLIEIATNNQVDELAVNNKVVATSTKNNARKALVNMLHDTANIFTVYFNGNTVEQRKYKLKNLSRISNAQLTLSANSFIALLNANPDALKSANISKDFMTELSAKLEDFVTCQANCTDAKRERKESTNAGNQALSNLIQYMAPLCKVAKNYWLQKSDSRYKDYILYSKPKSTASPPVSNAQLSTTPVVAPEKSTA